MCGSSCLDPLLAGVRDRDLIAAKIEQRAQRFGRVPIVFDHQNLQRRGFLSAAFHANRGQMLRAPPAFFASGPRHG